MKIFDVTMPIYEGMPVYKNKPEKQPVFHTVRNGYVSESRIELDVHTGTHVDAPLHMIVNGKTMETIPLEKLLGPCRVVDLTDAEDGVTAADLQKQDIKANEFLLFKTRNSTQATFQPEFIFVKEDAAHFLVERKVKGVGIDALGIERSQQGHPTHKALFEAGITIIEGLRLLDVPAGNYFMVAAPLRLNGTDAAPTRVLLIDGLRAE